MWHTSRLRWFATFALAIFALASVAPTLSRAVAFADPVAAAQVCSASGPVGSAADGPWMGLDCPMCLVQGHCPWAPTPEVSSRTLILQVGGVAPLPELSAPPTPALRLAGQPRAPPASA